jgi:hypothetical protein
MGIRFRLLLPATALLLAASSLHADESSVWGFGLGAAQPSGGAKQWVGSVTGSTIDVLESFSLGSDDTVRMRFGYFTFKGNRSTPDTLVLNGRAAALYPANTTSEAFTFSYGAEYVRSLPVGFYVLAGLGVAYDTATRKGTFDLTSAGQGIVQSNYGANNFVPYFSAGLGFQFTKSLALEARWQTSSLKAQTRPMDLGSGNTAQVLVDKTSLTAMTVGLTLTF